MAKYDSMSEEVEATPAEIAAIPATHELLQKSFLTGCTRSFADRKKNLIQLKRLLSDNTEMMATAVKSDLHEADVTPHLVDCRREVEYMIVNLAGLMSSESRTSDVSIVNFPARAELVPQPLGAVLIVGTWNYPFHSALGPLAGALAAGNTVLVKPGSLCRGSSRVIAELIGRYFDPSVVACVEGGKDVMTVLLDLKWGHIFFTGGTNIGKIVMTAAAKNLTPVTLELGGKNPVIVDETADIDLAARRIAWGKWASNAGQVCLAPDHVFVHDRVADALIEGLKKYIGIFFPAGPSTDEEYCRIISKGHTDRLQSMINTDQGFLVHGGEVSGDGKFVAPTILDFGSDLPKFVFSASMQSEIFGPILPIVRFTDSAQVEKLVSERTLTYPPLAFYVFTAESKWATRNRWIDKCSSGALIVNDCGIHIVEDCLPFGGTGSSGMGSYHGKKTFEIFSHYKPVLWKNGWLDIPMRYPPGSAVRRRIIGFLLWMARKNVTPVRLGKTMLVLALVYKIIT